MKVYSSNPVNLPSSHCDWNKDAAKSPLQLVTDSLVREGAVVRQGRRVAMTLGSKGRAGSQRRDHFSPLINPGGLPGGCALGDPGPLALVGVWRGKAWSLPWRVSPLLSSLPTLLWGCPCQGLASHAAACSVSTPTPGGRLGSTPGSRNA